MDKRKRLPRHVGVIPDGNGRWAQRRGLPKGAGYGHGIEPGLRLYRRCLEAGIGELSVYGFTQENVRRPAEQVAAFREACSAMAETLAGAGAAVQVIGDADSPAFPPGLRAFLAPPPPAPLKVNLLANYGWRWDVEGLRSGAHRTAALPPLELIVRWGGGRRLSGFLPLQSAYADFFVVDSLWPDFSEGELDAALEWYGRQDRTLGG